MDKGPWVRITPPYLDVMSFMLVQLHVCITYPPTDWVLGIYVFHPTIPGYPQARFPGVVVFSEIYQGRRR